MPVADWLRSLNLSDADVTDYETKFSNKEITDEQLLPNLGLVPQVQAIGVKLIHRQQLLDAISAIRGAAPAEPAPRTASPRAEARRDLIRRLFAVAISVGFAARLVRMQWLEKGELPDYTQFEELARLFTAMFVVVSGWEWYHRDVDRHPLEKSYRFIIDVMVVVLAMIFLYSSKNAGLWFVSFLTIFFLYVAWDAFSIREYPGDYGVQRPAHLGRIIRVYWSGLWNGRRRGPITNLSWFMYFVVISMLSWCVFKGQDYQAFVSCVFIMLGTIILRFDGNYMSTTVAPVAGWKSQRRLGVIIGLLVAYAGVSVLLYWWSAGQWFACLRPR
jgi:hypothetical protein